jgi:hypothetical protein
VDKNESTKESADSAAMLWWLFLKKVAATCTVEKK